MTSLQFTAYVAQVLAAISAVMLARRHAAYKPAAVALVAFAVMNVLDAPIAGALTPYPAEPWQGAARVLVYLDGAINLANYAVIAGLAVALASQKRRRVAVSTVVGVWLLASIALAALYPSPLVRGDSLQRIYFDADLIGLFVATVALITLARAGMAAKRSPDSAFAVALGLTLMDAAVLLAPISPWRADLFSMPYGGVQVAIAMFFVVITTAQVTTWVHTSRG